jgi:hypothetical protein
MCVNASAPPLPSQLLQASQRTESATQGGAKEAIECQAKIRKEVISLSEDMAELERLYQGEAKKRRVSEPLDVHIFNY